MGFIYDPEFWIAVSFFLFLGLLGYFQLHKKVADALDRRSELIAKEIAEAKRLREEAEAVLADYRKKQGNAAGEAEAIVKLASEEARSLAEDSRRQIKEQFERRTRLAEEKIGRAEADAVREVRAAAADAAILAAHTVISKKLTPEAASKLISDSINALKNRLN